MKLTLLSFALILALPAGAQFVLEPIATGLENPVAITHAGDERLFITLQDGRVVVHDGIGVRATPFLDIRSRVLAGGERGLLSIAFHPDYQQNGFFFVNYTDRDGHTIVARHSVSSDRNRASSSGAEILKINQPFSNHNGGQLQFGPDGYLYIGTGDGGSGGDPQNRAQNPSDLLGKMLRIDVDGDPPYDIPNDNPFLGVPGARGEIWAVGLRNPWRFSFDRVSGDLWIADVGQGDWEEVNHQPASSSGGENYGWRRMEGTHCFNPSSGCNDGTLVLPVIEYGHDEGCSVTGGYVYRGSRNPSLAGRYVYADYCSGVIWEATLRSGSVSSGLLVSSGFRVSAFGEDVHGELYVASHNQGRVYRIVEQRKLEGRRRAARH